MNTVTFKETKVRLDISRNFSRTVLCKKTRTSSSLEESWDILLTKNFAWIAVFYLFRIKISQPASIIVVSERGLAISPNLACQKRQELFQKSCSIVHLVQYSLAMCMIFGRRVLYLFNATIDLCSAY